MKRYRIRYKSPLWWAIRIAAVAALIVWWQLMNAWDLAAMGYLR